MSKDRLIPDLGRKQLLPLIVGFLLIPSGVRAHAVLLDSSPAIDAVLSGDEVEIRLHFNCRIDHVRSQMTLFAPMERSNLSRRPTIRPAMASMLCCQPSFTDLGACAGKF